MARLGFGPTITLLAAFTLAGCSSKSFRAENKKIRTSWTPDTANVIGGGPTYLTSEDPTSCDDECLDLLSISPNDIIDYASVQYRPIALQECIASALANSEVFRNLSGAVVSAPAGISTTIDPALTFSNPANGEDAALSAFDANFVASAFFENNDRPFNNLFSGDTNGLFVQDLGEVTARLSKLSATGTEFNISSTANYDSNNQAGNRYGQSYESVLDFGFRHPLLQGSGTLFNRIAGPSRIPGVYNGVLIARTNTEISLTDFQVGVRELVSNVENAYWDLYFAYKELEAQIESRDVAYEVFEKVEKQGETGRKGNLDIASAKEQYLRFETSIANSLDGRNIEGTQTSSGSSGGSFRRTVGVRIAERRLRYLMGMPITDGSLLQPSETPANAPLQFDWSESSFMAQQQRPEVRRQKWLIKQSELELTAAKNFLLPRLDLVGNYRFRGLGRELTGGSITLQDDIANSSIGQSSAFADLTGGDFQEVQLGAEYRLPVGFRQGHAAVRNAQLSVQREKAILAEQRKKITLDLSNAIGEVRRSYSVMLAANERLEAATDYFDTASELYTQNKVNIDVKLEAQRRILEAKLQLIGAQAEYAIAIKNVHFERGSYLYYHGVQMTESVSDSEAYSDFHRRNANLRGEISYVVRDPAVSNGQSTVNAGGGHIVTQFPLQESFGDQQQLTPMWVEPVPESTPSLNEAPLDPVGAPSSPDKIPNAMPTEQTGIINFNDLTFESPIESELPTDGKTIRLTDF